MKYNMEGHGINLRRLRSRSDFVHKETYRHREKQKKEEKRKNSKHKDTTDRKNKQQKDIKNRKNENFIFSETIKDHVILSLFPFCG